jgi:hypothetical protein|tara:strand:- start:1819 stop:2664 length:846 start_codon:yes stop_codon:yes gene_type:complete
MAKLKHSKFKNTGILFELLVKQIASDTLANKDSLALEIIKKHFKRGTELNKELRLYQSLTKENFDSQYQAQEFVNIVLTERSNLNEGILRRQKYNLIKSIKESFAIEDFFKYRVNSYREMASVYKMFENVAAVSPKEFVECKNTILETITKRDVEIVKETTDKEYASQPKEVRMLAYKFLIESFNSKYTTLSEDQKNILRNYINNIDNSAKLKSFVIREVKKLKKNLVEVKVSDKVAKIKLTETINLIDNITNSKIINENQILSLLRYHELLQELRRASNV